MSITGDSAREIARKKVLELCKKLRRPPERVPSGISEDVDATEVKKEKIKGE